MGANNCILTFPFARKIGAKGKVIAIEASPLTESQLVTGSILNGFNNIDSFNIAVIDKDEGEIFLLIDPRSSMLSRMTSDKSKV